MAKPISIGIGADTRDVAKAIASGIIDPLEEVADALDQVERDSQAAGRELDDSMRDASRSVEDVGREGERAGERLEDGMRDAQKETEQLGDEHKKLSDVIREQARESSRVRRDADQDATSSAKQGFGELRDEANSTAREAAASFDGSAESIGDAFQEVAANAFAGFGPAGALAGLAVAAGIGIGIQAIANGTEDTEAFRERVSELTDELIESGRVGGRAFDGMLDQLKDLASQTEDSELQLKDLRDLAEKLGDDGEEGYRRVVDAYLSGGDALDELIGKTEDLVDREGARQGAMYDTLGALREQEDALKAAQEAQELYLNAGASEFEVRVGQIESINEAYDEAASAIDEFSVTEGGALDPAKYIENMNARAEALANYKSDLAQADLSPEAKRFLNDQGVDSASRFMAGYKSATPEQREQLNQIWSEAGRENSGEYADSLNRGMPNTVEGPEVVLRDKRETYLSNLRSALTGRRIEIPIDLAVGRGGRYVP